MNKKSAEKNNSDFDDVFKTLKTKHPSLFIPLINKVFHRQYGMEETVTVLETDDSFLVVDENGTAKTRKRISDSLFGIRQELYQVECQSRPDGTMAVRMAEYTFLAGIRNAKLDGNCLIINMPRYMVVYVKGSEKIPEKTEIRYLFPDGQKVEYDSPNVIIPAYTMEEIFCDELYLFIPFYAVRYQEDIRRGTISAEQVEAELRKLLTGMEDAEKNGRLSAYDIVNLKAFTNKLIEHMYYDREEEKERLVKVMGGKVLVTEADLILERGERNGRKLGRKEAFSELNQAVTFLKEGGSVEELRKKNMPEDVIEFAAKII